MVDQKLKSHDSNDAESKILPEKKELESVLLERQKNEAVEMNNGKLDLRKGGNLVIGTMNVMVNPVKQHLKGRHEQFYKSNKFHLWADIFFVLAILSSVATFVFIKNLQPRAEIYLNSSLVSPAVSGGLSTFVINYRNNGKIDVGNASLSLTLPKNFHLVSVQPESTFSDQANTFKIGDLPRGANGQVKVSGVVYGEIGDQEVLAYSLNYSQGDRRPNFLGSLVFPIESSVLEVVLDMRGDVYKDINFGGKIIVKNKSSVDLDKSIELSFEDRVVQLQSVSGDKVNFVNGVAIRDGLKAGEEVVIEFEASSKLSQGDALIKMLVYLDAGGLKVKQTETVKQVRVLDPKLFMLLSSDKKYLNNEEVVPFKLALENGENEKISNIKMDLSPDTTAFVLKSLELKTENKNVSINGTTLFVGDLNPGEKIELNLEAVLSRKKINPDQEAGLLANASYKIANQDMNYKIYSQKIKILSDVQVSSKAVYYSAQGDQLGVGPLPPAVDVPTRYWVFWEIDNKGNDLKDVMMSAELPANVGWTNQKSLLNGDIRFAEIGRKVVWTINDMPKEGGQYRAGFEIELIPAQTDLGKVPNLLINTQYSAFDTFAEAEISGSVGDLNSDLKGDNLSSGKGKVIKLDIIK